MSFVFAGAFGIVLAASAGLRAFMPLFGVGMASRLTGWSLAPSMEWLATDVALVLLGVATLVEIVADKVPVVDHVLDVVHTVVGPLAGALVAFSVWVDLPPGLSAILALALGAPIAGGVHAMSALARVKSTILSGGTFNPAVSLAEDGVTAGTIIMTLIAPTLALFIAPILIAVVLGFVLRRFTKESLRDKRGQI